MKQLTCVVHFDLNIKTKLFCGCVYDVLAVPNSCCCPVCLGLPGSLPALNKAAVEKILLLGKLFESHVHKISSFYKKTNFSPDLPLGYQVSQHTHPLISGGCYDGIKIKHLHLQTNKALLLPSDDTRHTLIDFNPSGTARIELMTEAVFDHHDDIQSFILKLSQFLKSHHIISTDAQICYSIADDVKDIILDDTTYFPDSDIAPLIIDEEFINQLTIGATI